LIEELASRHDYVRSFEPPGQEAVAVQTSGINQLILTVRAAGLKPDRPRKKAVTQPSSLGISYFGSMPSAILRRARQ
jgi:hypothetical protein